MPQACHCAEDPLRRAISHNHSWQSAYAGQIIHASRNLASQLQRQPIARQPLLINVKREHQRQRVAHRLYFMWIQVEDLVLLVTHYVHRGARLAA